MFATVRHYCLEHVDQEALLADLGSAFLPLLAELEGFVSYAVMTDATGQVYSMTVCEDEDSCNRSTELAARWHQRELPGTIVEIFDVTTGPVISFAAQPQSVAQARPRSSSTP
jgi:hypothetical protein